MKLAKDLTAADFKAMGFETADCSRFREETYMRCIKGNVVVFLHGDRGVDIELVSSGAWGVHLTGQTPVGIVMAVLSACPA